MKKCPFCAEEIQDEAIKCKHCNTLLVAQQITLGDTQPTTMSSQLFAGILAFCAGLTITGFGVYSGWFAKTYRSARDPGDVAGVCLLGIVVAAIGTLLIAVDYRRPPK